MNPSDITAKLVRLQGRLEYYRGNTELTELLESTYWREVERLRALGCYDRLPYYVGWLAAYHAPPEEYTGAD